jgi:hypothetical protein
MCSSTSAQKTQSNESDAKSSFVTSPATVKTRGISKRGLSKSSAVTSEKYSVSNREKCPSLAPMSSTDRRLLGSKHSRSVVRAFSSSLARYFSRFLSTPASRICLRFYLRPNCSSDKSPQVHGTNHTEFEFSNGTPSSRVPRSAAPNRERVGRAISVSL